jgi:DNA replication and repair protein RecF
MPDLLRLTLNDFRSYAQASWRPGARLSVVHGPNGSGKTNLLEAVSLLSPGRGLRGARIGELARRREDGAEGLAGGVRWAVSGRFDSPEGAFDLGTGMVAARGGEGGPDRRTYRLDGEEPRSQAEIASRFSAVWLTPQMDGLFQESASGRRRFLDRLVWALEPGHAREAASHDTAMAGRNRLLAGRGADPAWLAGLEASMARHAVALAASRASFVARLNAAPLPDAAFPRAALALADPIADRLAVTPALAVETWLRGALAARRAEDAAQASAGLGAHRADLRMRDAATGLPAAQASTGQQKALLIGIILAHAALVAEARGAPPMLLLDEPAVHLDAGRRDALFAALAALAGPAIVTGTDADIFASLRGRAGFWRAGQGSLVEDD